MIEYCSTRQMNNYNGTGHDDDKTAWIVHTTHCSSRDLHSHGLQHNYVTNYDERKNRASAPECIVSFADWAEPAPYSAPRPQGTNNRSNTASIVFQLIA